MNRLFHIWVTVVLGVATTAIAADDETFSGIGVTIVESVVGVRVATVLPGGAADQSGELRPHDAIIAVAEAHGKAVNLRGKTVEEAVELIRGKPGSEIQLTIIPADSRVVKRKVIALERALVTAAVLAAGPEVGKRAPDFNFMRLDTGKRGSLADFAGKVVVMDFWATWCGPCQGPIAKMQELTEKYPEWRDKVVWVTMSVDRNRDQVETHLKQRGWSKTLNLWDDKGAAQIYQVTAIPELFIINADGEIVTIGHPGAMDVPAAVAKALGEPLPEKEKPEDAEEPVEEPTPDEDRVPIQE